MSGRDSAFSRGACHVLFRAARLPLVLTWYLTLTCGSSKLSHATAATTRATALASRLNQVRVTEGLKPSVSYAWAVPAPLHAKTDSRRNERMRSLEDPTVVKAVAASVMERLEPDVAPKEILVIHCSLAVSRCNGSPCHWIKTSQAERVGLPLVKVFSL